MKKKRSLQSGREVKSQDEELHMTIASKCPAKWLFVDLETGDVWHHREGTKENDVTFWRRANTIEIKELFQKLRVNH